MQRSTLFAASVLLVLGLASCTSDAQESDPSAVSSPSVQESTSASSDGAPETDVKPMLIIPNASVAEDGLTERGLISLIGQLKRVEVLPWDNDLGIQEDGKMAVKVTATYTWDSHLANQDVVVTDLGTGWVITDASGAEYLSATEADGSPVYLLPSDLETVTFHVRGSADATEDPGTAAEVTTRLDLETTGAEVNLKSF